MREQEHNYQVESLPMGFRILPIDESRPVLSVTLEENGFWDFSDDNYHSTNFPLYGFYDLMHACVYRLYQSWGNPKNYTDGFVPGWVFTRTSKCLNHPIHKEWKRVISQVDPLTEEVHRKLFSLSLGKGYWGEVKNLLKNNNQHLISDVLSYKAAACSVLYASNYMETDWMLAFARGGEKYSSLTKTLMNLPNNIVYGMLPNLRDLRLPEPAYSRVRLFSYLSIPWTKREEYINIVKRSSDEDIKKGIRLMWHYFPSEKTKAGFKSSVEIVRALNLIFDYSGDIGKWDMAGLAKRSEAYHHNEALRIEQRRVEWERESEEYRIKRLAELKLLEDAKTRTPPIKLPEDKNIYFLDTYNSVIKEGEIMKHCIADYAERAVRGESYLFHVDYKGETASVEVNPRGFVKQSYGPKDTFNKASYYGKKVLDKWAKPLREMKIDIPQGDSWFDIGQPF